MKALFVGFFLLIGIQSYSQNYKKITGMYLINKEKVNWGQAPESVLPSFYKINSEKRHIAIIRKMSNIPNEILEDMKLDGTPYSRDIPTGKATASFNPVDDNNFTVEKKWVDTAGKMTMKSKETWTIENGGKNLTIKYDVEQADGNIYTLIGYYEKE